MIQVPYIFSWSPTPNLHKDFQQHISCSNLSLEAFSAPSPHSPFSDRFLELSGLLTISHHVEMGKHALDYKPTFPVIHCLACNFILDSPRRFPNDLDTGLKETKSILSFRYEGETIDPMNHRLSNLCRICLIHFPISLSTTPPS